MGYLENEEKQQLHAITDLPIPINAIVAQGQTYSNVTIAQEQTLLELTFGIELEFLAEYDAEQLDSEVENVRILRELAGTLDTAGVAVNPEIPIPKTNTDFSKWTVGLDGSLTPFARDFVGGRPQTLGTKEAAPGRQACLAEIATPILKLADKNWQEEIKNVIDRVVVHFGEKGGNRNAYTNDSCGLHVHVGNGYRGFPLSTYKNLGILLYAYERSIDRIHPPPRVMDNGQCMPLNQVLTAQGKLVDLATVALSLESASGWEEFLDRFNSHSEALAYNFSHYATKKTIEFRQHHGTLDSWKITPWVKLCCALVKFAHEMQPGDAFIMVLNRLRGHDRCDVLELLASVGEYGLVEELGSEMYDYRGAYEFPERTLEGDLEVLVAVLRLEAAYHRIVTSALLSRQVTNDEEVGMDISSPGDTDGEPMDDY